MKTHNIIRLLFIALILFWAVVFNKVFATPPFISLQAMGADQLYICYQNQAEQVKDRVKSISMENAGALAVDLFWKCENENRKFSGMCASYYNTTGIACNMASVELAKSILIDVIGAEK